MKQNIMIEEVVVSVSLPQLIERIIMYFIYDTKTKINRGFADTKEEAELLLKELSHKWYYKYLVIR
tara:strand:- start:130 stop:327 length:198 start_codon:yes stop_codon:yes gene_type:complete